MQTNNNVLRKEKSSIPWLLLSVVAKMKLKDSVELDLDARLSSDFSESELWPLASKLLPKVKIVQGKPKVSLRPVITKKVVNVGKGKTKKLQKPRASCEGIISFVDWYHRLPENIY